MTEKEQQTALENIEKAKINLETAKIAWQELERFFAAGSVIYVADDLALIDVAYALSQDDSERFKTWMAEGKVEHISDQQAIKWHEEKASVWSVVVRPWVLVQEIKN